MSVFPPRHPDPPTLPDVIGGIPISRPNRWTLLALGHHDAAAVLAAGATLAPDGDRDTYTDLTQWQVAHTWAIRQPKCNCPDRARKGCRDDALALVHDPDPDPAVSRIDTGEPWGVYDQESPSAFPVTEAISWGLLLPRPKGLSDEALKGPF